MVYHEWIDYGCSEPQELPLIQIVPGSIWWFPLLPLHGKIGVVSMKIIQLKNGKYVIRRWSWIFLAFQYKNLHFHGWICGSNKGPHHYAITGLKDVIEFEYKKLTEGII